MNTQEATLVRVPHPAAGDDRAVDRVREVVLGDVGVPVAAGTSQPRDSLVTTSCSVAIHP
ncbi:hypothetical protein ETD86_27150 [Nonomuraea turkmeniaca]|uniref:Uncharacterized protein n=1 Tax=Nonomuraea turkmeniaca TaxID=103838 RepID=A0A5S4FC19_9ACTN|nr:hypothetical protein [Nonomuraea turkmeniaca]TMR15458.1 hypothetical protein ETD86_27150 [Nonomuraea turkmeniaca]